MKFAQINHIAIVSSDWTKLGRFYESVFNLEPPEKRRPLSGVTVGDGYAGININTHRDGGVAALDHFGFLVEDADEVVARMKKKYPETAVAKRPATRPFAAFSGHDPDGNVFDLAQRKVDHRSAVYVDRDESEWHKDCYINKYAIRTLHAERVAEFYRDVFELEPLNRKTEAPGHHLTDGRVILSILPWSIDLFNGFNIKRPGADHLGFHVDDMETFKERVKMVSGKNHHLAPVPLGGSEESDGRMRLFQGSALGKMQMADPDGNWIDVTDE
jgi:catechol 2,3-dioxygenase-like lactoylglutathione lyase family enzyme